MNSIKAPPLECHGIGELSPQNILGEALSKFQQRLLQHRFRQDQLADQIEYAVDSFRIHSQQVVGAAWYGGGPPRFSLPPSAVLPGARRVICPGYGRAHRALSRRFS